MPTTTSRLGLLQQLGTDTPTEIRLADTANTNTLDAAVMSKVGILAARPAANSVPADTIYRCTDVAAIFHSDGAQWHYIPVDAGAHPIGAVAQYAGPSDPADVDGVTRWLVCDGRAISRSTYATLFAAVSTLYGSGDGTSTFNIPDLRGRVIVGAGSGSGLTTRTRGQTGGEENHSLVTGELASHNHGASGLSTGSSGTGISDSGHAHYMVSSNLNVPAASGAWSFSQAQSGTGTFGYTPNVNSISSTGYGVATASGNASISDPGHSHSVNGSTASNGSGTGHNNVQPFGVVNHIIKVQ